MNKKQNARTRILNYLENGYDITTNQARSRFGITNVAARIAELRDDGFPVYTNRKNINGNKVFVYRLGEYRSSVKSTQARRTSLLYSAA